MDSTTYGVREGRLPHQLAIPLSRRLARQPQLGADTPHYPANCGDVGRVRITGRGRHAELGGLHRRSSAATVTDDLRVPRRQHRARSQSPAASRYRSRNARWTPGQCEVIYREQAPEGIDSRRERGIAHSLGSDLARWFFFIEVDTEGQIDEVSEADNRVFQRLRSSAAVEDRRSFPIPSASVMAVYSTSAAYPSNP